MGKEIITEQVLDCSFCGISEGDVEFLVEGEGVYICDVCVNKANDIVKENLQNDFSNENQNTCRLQRCRGRYRIWVSCS